MRISKTLALGAGRSLHLLDGGEGPTIVLIHGALTTHVDWLEAPFEAFAARGRAIAVDRPGHGLSARPRYQASPRAQAAQIREGLAALGAELPVRLVAHSFGGIVALAWAAEWPEEVASLLLLSPITRPEFRAIEHSFLGPRAAPLIGPLLSEAARWTLDRPFLRAVQKLMFSPRNPPPDWLARFPEETVLSPAQMVEEGEDTATLLPGSPLGLVDWNAIRCPVAVVNGADDRIVDHRQHADVLAELIPQATATLLEGVGHMPHHQALPEVLAAFDAVNAPERASREPARSAEPPPPA
ncbi:alpha/beta fold hydrolase [Phenylobacterium sp.]|uniref:alpha/beta fold hydrolase n=1 Tax=Phenylobacterium sp. TaxID=1871053 RepID=UPI0035AFB088